MLKPILLTTLIALVSACAHQSGGDNSSDARDSRTRVDDAFERDGYCDQREARQPERYGDCRQQAKQQQRQRRTGLPTDELMNERDINDLGREIDRSVPNLRGDGLGL